MADTRTDLLLTRPAERLVPALADRPTWMPGLVAAGWSAGVGMVALGALALVGWLGGGAPGEPTAALGAGAALWLVGHGSGVELAGLPVTLVPWGLTLLLLYLLHRAGRWAAATAVPARARDAVLGALVPSLAYGAAATVVAVLAGSAAVSVDPRRAFATATAVALAGLGSGVARETGLGRNLLERLPARARRIGRAAGLGAAAVLAAGAVLVVLALLGSLGRVHALLTGLDAGVVGGALLSVLGAALLPSMAVWASAVAIGPGFTMGAGTSVVSGGTAVGVLPALPVLGALPERVPAPLGVLLLALPLAAGAAASWSLQRRSPGLGLVQSLADALLAAVGAGLLLGLAAWLTSGAAGASQLASVGAAAAPVALAAAVELGVGAAVTTLVMRRR